MKHTINHYLLLISCILPLGCFGQKKLTLKNLQSFEAPSIAAPNTVQVNDTLFCDETEISNLDWLLYDFTVKEVYGDSSEEYNLLKLDWDGVIELEKDYLRYPGYRLFPLISVSLEQAQKYADWRTKTVFSLILKRLKLISEDSLKKWEHFSIDDFFNSHPELQNKLYYFEYRIPTEEEWRLSYKYAKEIDSKYSKKYKKVRRRKSKMETSELDNGLSDIYFGEKVTKRRNPILKMNDNVSEIILEEGYSMGGNYFEKDTEGIKNKFERPNAWTGFRCVGSWKKWGE